MQILPPIQEKNDWVMSWEIIVQSTFIWANYLLPNSPYCMLYLWGETERENWSWSLLGVKGLNKLYCTKKSTAIQSASFSDVCWEEFSCNFPFWIQLYLAFHFLVLLLLLIPDWQKLRVNWQFSTHDLTRLLLNWILFLWFPHLLWSWADGLITRRVIWN